MVSIILTKREHASTPVGLGRRCVMSFSIYKSVFIYRNNEYKTAADVPNRKFETSSCFVEKRLKKGIQIEECFQNLLIKQKFHS